MEVASKGGFKRPEKQKGLLGGGFTPLWVHCWLHINSISIFNSSNLIDKYTRYVDNERKAKTKSKNELQGDHHSKQDQDKKIEKKYE